MKKFKQNSAITLIVLVITIIILLILVGVAISCVVGENGLISKAKQTKKTQIKAEFKEQLVLALSELQLNKKGEATLDDITKEWVDNKLKDYKATIINDASISEKKIKMTKNGVTGRYKIDEKLNIIEIEETTGIQLTYEVKSREGENLQVLITVTDNENGLQQIEYYDGHIQNVNGLKSVSRDCTMQLGVEYKVKITSKSGEEKTETILINQYYHTITKNFSEGIKIDNLAIKTAYNQPYQATITTANEYILESLKVTMGGEEVTVDKATGLINIEKVTGDIEITAKAKKLEIIVSEVYVNTSMNATSSATANSIDRTTHTLYVNFTATLEGENCTINPSLSEAITRNGTYIYTITGTYQGKTIIVTKEVTVDQYKSTSGLVQYDAGDWTQIQIQELQNLNLYDLNAEHTYNSYYKLKTEEGLTFTFGGFTYKGSLDENKRGVITNRNQSVASENGYGTPTYNGGWQLMETEIREDENGNIIKNANGTDRIYVKSIVHVGCPENFVFTIGPDDSVWYQAERANYIMSGGVRSTEYNTIYLESTTLNTRNWDMYKDNSQLKLIDNVHCMTMEELYRIRDNEIVNTGSSYWVIGETNNFGNQLGFWNGVRRNGVYYSMTACLGIRPVVELVDNVYIESGVGTEASPYILGIEE